MTISHQESVSYKPRTSWALYIYVLTSVKNYFQNSLWKFSKFAWNEVDNWCNFTVSSITEQWHICSFLKLQVWTMKLTESTSTSTSDRVACTIKVNIKETFMGNEGFLQMFMWWIDCSQKIRDLLLGKFSI